MTACSPSSFILLIRPSHTNFDDKDENPTLASLTIFPQCAPFFWQRSSLVICISVYVPASMLCTALSPAWPSYWCLCCGGHLERCPAAAHERCPYPSSPYSSAWRGCQPRLPSLPGWAMVSNCQCLCTSSAEGDTVFRRAAKLVHVFIFNKWQTVTLTRVSRLPKSRLWSVYANKLVALTGFLAKEIRFLKKKKRQNLFLSLTFGSQLREVAQPKFDLEPNSSLSYCSVRMCTFMWQNRLSSFQRASLWSHLWSSWAIVKGANWNQP